MKRMSLLLAAVLLSMYQLGAQCLTITNCPASTEVACDFSTNNDKFWNASYWFDNVIGGNDLAEGVVDFSITAKDNCFAGGLTISYQLFLDLDGDGVQETVVDSKTPPPAGVVFYGNAANPNYSGGTFRVFDQRPVAPLLKYRFGIQISGVGNTKTARMRWRTASTPATYTAPQLPYGTHKIKWIAETANGAQKTCEYTFIVKDCKKPTIVCLNGLSVNIMPTHMVTLWASDFLQYAEDNVTPVNQLKIGVRKSGTGTGFPVDANGNPITSVTFTCDDQGTQLVEVWTIDLAGNADFCETYVIVQDNLNNCMVNGNSLLKTCLQQYCSGTPIVDAAVAIMGSSPAIPSFTFTNILFDSSGCFNFPPAIPVSSNSIIVPFKDDNPLNGVTSFDVSLIQAHIDGTQPFTEPWQFIAADINKSNSISFTDVIELQKLIAGVYTDFPNNTSWRFVQSDYVFPNPANPFSAPFPESATISNFMALLDTTIVFKGIKIGDLDCSAAGFNGQIPVEREATKAVNQTTVSPPQPNPTSGSSTIALQLAQAGKVRLDLFDLSGKTVYFVENQMDAGPAILEIPLDSRFAPGIYFWKVQIEGTVYSGKLVRE